MKQAVSKKSVISAKKLNLIFKTNDGAVHALKDIDLMTPRRYIDWFITTPTMLLSTIIFMEYLKNEKTFTFKEFMNEHKINITLIFISNALMLALGYMGEIGKMNKTRSVFAGFIPFMLSFYIIYENYAKHTELGFKLFIRRLSFGGVL